MPKKLSYGVYTYRGLTIERHLGFSTLPRKHRMFEWWEIREIPQAGRFTKLKQATEFTDKR